MPRMVDASCTVCDYQIRDQFLQEVPDVLYHDAGGGVMHPMEYLYLPRTRMAEWSDRDAIVVFKKPDGTYDYPARNDKPTPPGCERVVIKNLREAERFEKLTGTRNEAIWYDRGSGRSIEDDAPRRTRPTEAQRLDAFMRGWGG